MRNDDIGSESDKFLGVLFGTIAPRVGIAAKRVFRYTLESRLNADIAPCPKGADIVAKVENRTTLKISRKLIFRTSLLLRRFQRPCGGP
jgi:hypothetical protein